MDDGEREASVSKSLIYMDCFLSIRMNRIYRILSESPGL